MAAIAKLKFGAPKTTADTNQIVKSVTREYQVLSTDQSEAVSWSDALSTVATAAPLTIGNATRGDIKVEGFDLTENVWECSVAYNYNPEEVSTGGSMDGVQWGVTSGAMLVTQALEHEAKFPNVSTTPEYYGLINVQKGGTPQGVEITFPVFTESFSQIWDSSGTSGSPTTWLSPTKKAQIASAVGSTNTKAFNSWGIGECRLDGVTSEIYNTFQQKITYQYSISLASSGTATRPYIVISLNGTPTNITKGGWEYLWVQSDRVWNTTAKTDYNRPMFAYVERVYRETDFDLLLAP